MHLRTLALGLAALLGLAAARPAAASETLYAIGDGGASLLRFQSDSPGNITRVGTFGGAATFLDGLDYRASTGQLVGYLDSTDSIYYVDSNTGSLTLASTSSVPTNTFNLGIDFNPQVVTNGVLGDRLRIVTESQQNLRVNLANGATINDGTLTYAANDVNANSPATLIVEAAYTNNDTDINTPTKLYYIDHGLDILATTTAPNDGILTTVGSLGVDTGDLVGFEIFTSGGTNTAYAILNPDNTPGLYRIDLNTGAATSLGVLGTGFGNIYGLAAVPEPSSLLLSGLGAAVLAGVALRRRRANRAA